MVAGVAEAMGVVAGVVIAMVVIAMVVTMVAGMVTEGSTVASSSNLVGGGTRGGMEGTGRTGGEHPDTTATPGIPMVGTLRRTPTLTLHHRLRTTTALRRSKCLLSLHQCIKGRRRSPLRLHRHRASGCRRIPELRRVVRRSRSR